MTIQHISAHRSKAFLTKTCNYTFQNGADIGSITIHQVGRASGQREWFNWKGSRACKKFHAEAVSN